jgi:predicted DNA binding protein
MELRRRRLVSTPGLFRTFAEERLTDRQLTAFRLAYYAGYFDRPRESSGDDLAQRMAITRQTFHHHLRAAQRIVAHFLLEGVNEGDTRVVHGGGNGYSDQ